MISALRCSAVVLTAPSRFPFTNNVASLCRSPASIQENDEFCEKSTLVTHPVLPVVHRWHCDLRIAQIPRSISCRAACSAQCAVVGLEVGRLVGLASLDQPFVSLLILWRARGTRGPCRRRACLRWDAANSRGLVLGCIEAKFCK